MSVRYSGLSLPLVDDDARLEPYLLLPSQTRQNRARSPEERLWWAVLERAWEDLRGTNRGPWGRKNLRSDEAAAWFQSDSEAVMSFRWVCLMLGMEPQISHLRPLRADSTAFRGGKQGQDHP